MSTFEVGQWVVLRGKAVGRISEINTQSIVIEEADLEAGEESAFEVPVDRAVEALRPIVTAAEAEALLARLGSAEAPTDSRSVADRALAYRRANKGGEIDAQVQALGTIYRRPEPDAPERQYQALLEKTIFSELARALKKTRKAVKADVRAAALGQKKPAALALPDHAAALADVGALPALIGCDPIGPFFIDTRLAIGEFQASVTTAAEPGLWFAYCSGDMDSDDFEMFAVHHSVARIAAELRTRAEKVGEVVAEGATMAIFDAAEADDEEFVEGLARGEGIVGQRCAAISIGGDGRFAVHVAKQRERAVCVRVVF